MKRVIILILFFHWSFLNAQIVLTKGNNPTFSLPPNLSAHDYIPNLIIVKLKELKNVVDSSNFFLVNGTFRLKTAKIISIEKKFPQTQNRAYSLLSILDFSPANKNTQNKEVDLSSIYELRYTSTEGIETVINELLQSSNIEYAEPHYVNRTFYVPNDPYSNTAQTYLSQVNAFQSWDIVKNSSNVVIAVVDNGSDLSHEDLKSNLFKNNGDPINGIDDDQDGYIDNYIGWDLVGSSSTNIKADNDPNIKSSDAIHGIHVSGLASAVSDNSIGISSVAFNAKLLIVKTAADDDPNTITMGYEGIKYAADNGANIINCSWGSTAGGKFGEDIINYALSKNCLIVAAAGNSGNSDLIYPAAYSGVMAVANVRETDILSPSSNFGDYISICAPGTNIFSTINSNGYGILSGTSMAAPIVSSAAALIKSHFPNLTMQQVGERLRVSADNIDNKNPNVIGLLGKGRLNVFNSLTQSSPSIRNQKLTIASSNSSRGDTIVLYFDLKNILDPAKNLEVSLTSSSSFIKILNSSINIGDVDALQTKYAIGPFKLVVLSTAPDNAWAQMRLNYNANFNSYQDKENFRVPVSLDFLDVSVNKIGTTMTSNGRVGYNNSNGVNGLGFLYQNHNYLYEASLMIGNAPTAVSNNARNGIGSDEHFVKKVQIQRKSNGIADFEATSEFNDSLNPKSLGLYVKHRQLAYGKAPDDKYSIIEYEVINKSNTELRNLFIGMFTDWDVDLNGEDFTKYDSFNKLAYTYGRSGNSKYAGVKLLTKTAAPLYYPLAKTIPGNPLFGDFTIDQKYRTLSNGIKSLQLEGNTLGSDVSFVSGYGPFRIAPNASVKVAFAFLVGDDLNDLVESAQAADNKYLKLIPNNLPPPDLRLEQNYPNPALNSTLIQFSIPSVGLTSLDLFDLSGKKVNSLLNQNLSEGTYTVNLGTGNLAAGTYIYMLTFNKIKKALKMIIIK